MTLIFAEIGASHNGSLSRALETVDAAAEAGANAVKVQCYTADTMVADRSYVLTSGPWKGWKLHDLYAQGQMPWEWIADVFIHAKARGIQAFASPFDETAVRFLEGIACPTYKVASFELTDEPLLREISKTGKPVMLSTGMATDDEITRALALFRSEVTLLKCTSAYPAPVAEMNLATLVDMRGRFSWCRLGLSDHTGDSLAATMAIALGATVIEKHITLKDEGGLDDCYALNPAEFGRFVQACRAAEAAMGEVHYGATPAEEPSLALRRGLYAVRDIREGEDFTPANVKARRPAGAIPPAGIVHILGFVAKRAIRAGEAIDAGML